MFFITSPIRRRARQSKIAIFAKRRCEEMRPLPTTFLNQLIQENVHASAMNEMEWSVCIGMIVCSEWGERLACREWKYIYTIHVIVQWLSSAC